MSTANAKTDIRDAFFDCLYELAARDRNVVFLTADMGAMAIERFRKELPGQFLNVGVAEQNMVSVAAGLALSGKKVFIYAIAPFVTMRCYEQIKVDISGMCLPVTIVGAGPGITYDFDGPTHHAVQDIAVIRALPNMTIINPSDPCGASSAARFCYESRGPVYVRIDKGKYPQLYDGERDFRLGMTLLRKGRDVLVVATGVIVHTALKIASELETHSLDVGVLDVGRLKPVDEELLLSHLGESRAVITLEEHSITGGLASIVSEALARCGKAIPMRSFGLADEVCDRYGNRDWMHRYYGLDSKTVCDAVLALSKKGQDDGDEQSLELTPRRHGQYTEGVDPASANRQGIG